MADNYAKYAISKTTLDSIATQTMTLSGTDAAMTTDQIRQAVVDANVEVAVQAQKIAQVLAILDSKTAVTPVIKELSVTENGVYIPPSGVDGYAPVNINVPSRAPVIVPLEITKNGTYVVPEGVDGYSPIVVNVDGLPDGYTKLNYLTAQGNQYIDTGVVGNQNTRIVCRVKCIVDDTNWVYGARYSSSSRLFTFAASSSGYYNAAYGNQRYSFPTSVNSSDFMIIDHNKSVITINGDITHSFSSETFTTPNNIILFGCNTNGTITASSTVSSMYYKIFDGDTLIRDYVPCINARSEYGMYERVSGAFCSNAGTGSFTGG